MSDNTEILIIWHLRVVPRPEVYFILEKKASLMKQALKKTASMKQAYLRDMLWYLLTLCLLVHPLLQLIRHQKT
jgi:hypothetical protein